MDLLAPRYAVARAMSASLSDRSIVRCAVCCRTIVFAGIVDERQALLRVQPTAYGGRDDCVRGEWRRGMRSIVLGSAAVVDLLEVTEQQGLYVECRTIYVHCAE